MTADFIPIRLEITGPEEWATKFVDARTGEILPIHRGFTVNFKWFGLITVDCTIEISEVISRKYLDD